MTSRSHDASYLTQLKAARNQAYFFNRQTASLYPNANPQTGVYDASKLGDLTVGVMPMVTPMPGPLPVSASPACTCTADLPNYIERN